MNSTSKTDWLLLGVLLALVLPLRLWLLYNTEVTARDSIGYIRYALQFEQVSGSQTLHVGLARMGMPETLQDVLAKNHQHPGYPALVWLMSKPVRWLDGATTPENMERSAQLVNLLASLLLILPMYLLGRQFFERPIAFAAALLYQYLPINAQLLSDGLSEPVFLVFVVAGLLQGVHAIRDRRIERCALTGLFTGLAYLTRPEGALILPAFLGMLLLLQLRAGTRCSWKRFFLCSAALLATAMLVGSIYVAATGHITNKLSALGILRKVFEKLCDFLPSAHNPFGVLHGQTTLFAVTFQPLANKWLNGARCVWALCAEINQGFHYVASVPAVLGLCWSFGRLRRDAGFWFLAVFCLVHAFILIALAMSVSYVSDRHVMILVMCGTFFAVAGMRELPRRLLSWQQPQPTASSPPIWRSANFWFVVLVAAFIGFCLPKSLQRLHGSRVGNHQAGLWLAGQLKDGDIILDDHAWSHYFSGLFFQEGLDPEINEEDRPTCFIVVTRSRDAEQDGQGKYVSADARVVFTWPNNSPPEQARIVVYAQPRDPRTHPWKKRGS
jgi:4-amino-4-deoxy-L-arabinose transferase-like glycosyltransferase